MRHNLGSGGKSNVEDLAVFGGVPAFPEPLHVGRPNIGDRQRLLQRIEEVLDSKWLTNNGPQVQELERRVADLLQVEHCIVTCNATVALGIAAQALGLTGEVIVPAFTFVATAHALQWQGITPVFCDVDANTHTLDCARVEQAITDRTTGILGVHLWGRACDIDGLQRIATRHNLKLVFDAAHAFGCSYQGWMIGGFGDAEVFSLHATKVCNAFEGAAITTNNPALAARIRLGINFGFADYDQVTSLGINGKMSEVSAAMGLTSLESFQTFVDRNHQNYHHYRDQLARIPGITVMSYDETESCNYHYIILEVDARGYGLTRDELQSVLWAENLLARRYFYPGCHRMEPYASSSLNRTRHPLPVTERLAARVLCLPTGSAIGLHQIQRIAQLVRFVGQESASIRPRLPRTDVLAKATRAICAAQIEESLIQE